MTESEGGSYCRETNERSFADAIPAAVQRDLSVDQGPVVQ
jgi:hypothetical protein